ncbi:MAG TPA: GtrA family protein [Burkholderiales bacterium]|jgi:putative flippase GtrA
MNSSSRGTVVRRTCLLSARSFLCFALIGTLATGLQYFLMFGLIAYAAMSAIAASVIAFCVSATFNYACNAAITFQSDQPPLETAPRFAVTAGIGLLINTGLLSLLLSLGLDVIVAQILTTASVLLWNFCINAIWTFSRRNA